MKIMGEFISLSRIFSIFLRLVFRKKVLFSVIGRFSKLKTGVISYLGAYLGTGIEINT